MLVQLTKSKKLDLTHIHEDCVCTRVSLAVFVFATFTHRSILSVPLSVATLTASASHVNKVETFRVSHIYFAKKQKYPRINTFLNGTGEKQAKKSPKEKFPRGNQKIKSKLQVDNFRPTAGSEF